MEEDNNTIDNDMMASMNDGIEVIIPKKIQELIERIKEKKGLHRQKIIHKRAELKRCENQKKSDGIKKDLLDLENGEKVLLRNIGEKYRGAEIQEENLSLEVDALAQLDEYKSRLIHYKNQEFNDAIITELRKFNKMRGFKYYVLFLEFQSYNITEMAEYSLMKKLVKDNFKADNILDHLFVDVSGDMDIGHLIEEIDYALGKELKPIKDKGFSGELNEELAVWIILYFHCPFYLSELALELLIKFLNEVYSIPGFCFAFIF